MREISQDNICQLFMYEHMLCMTVKLLRRQCSAAVNPTIFRRSKNKNNGWNERRKVSSISGVWVRSVRIGARRVASRSCRQHLQRIAPFRPTVDTRPAGPTVVRLREQHMLPPGRGVAALHLRLVIQQDVAIHEGLVARDDHARHEVLAQMGLHPPELVRRALRVAGRVRGRAQHNLDALIHHFLDGRQGARVGLEGQEKAGDAKLLHNLRALRLWEVQLELKVAALAHNLVVKVGVARAPRGNECRVKVHKRVVHVHQHAALGRGGLVSPVFGCSVGAKTLRDGCRVFLEHFAHTELLQHALAAHRPHGLAQLGGLHQALQPRAVRGHVPSLDQEALSIVGAALGNAGNAAADHGPLERHRLADDKREDFVQAGTHDNVACLIEWKGVLLGVQHDHIFAQVCLFDFSLDLIHILYLVWANVPHTHNQQLGFLPQLWVFCAQACKGLDRVDLCFPLAHGANVEDHNVGPVELQARDGVGQVPACNVGVLRRAQGLNGAHGDAVVDHR
mmetsp:Transcript_31567/g.79164  ORF Transcript_31567/g.79164 Transcript_31567/m.79164 type:complete len:507 (+) Transcript_31567:289-1809(+)